MVNGERHFGRLWNEETTIETMHLKRDEYITTVFDHLKTKEITQIGFVTNHGRECRFGGQEGQKFIVRAPEGNQLASIGGTLLTGLASIILEVLPVPSSLETKNKLSSDTIITTKHAYASGETTESAEAVYFCRH